MAGYDTNINLDPTNPQAGQSEAGWLSDAAKNGWSNPQDLLGAINKYNNAGTSEFDPSSDPTLQKLISQGYLTPTQTGGSDSNTSIYSAANLPQSAKGWAPAFFQQTGDNYKGPILPGNTVNDPLYGKISGNEALPQTKSLLDTVGPMIPLLAMGLPGLIQGMSSGGLEGGLSALQAGAGQGSGLAKFGAGLVENLGNGGSLDPRSLFGMAAGGIGSALGLPSSVSGALPGIMGMLQSGKMNPIQLAMMLSRGIQQSSSGGGS